MAIYFFVGGSSPSSLINLKEILMNSCEMCGRKCEKCDPQFLMKSIFFISKGLIGFLTLIGLMSCVFIVPHIIFQDAVHVITSDEKFAKHIDEYVNEHEYKNTFYLIRNSKFDRNLDDIKLEKKGASNN